MKSIIITLLVGMIAGPALAGEPASKPSTKPSDLAAERAAKLKDNVKSFALSLKYHGPQDKPYYNLLLSVPNLPDAKLKPFHLSAQITAETAEKIIDYLAADGFLERAVANPRLRSPVPPNEPYYALLVEVGDKANTGYEEWLVFDLKMLHRLDGLHNLLDGDAAKAMNMLLGRMEGHRKEWERQANSQRDVTEVITDLFSDDGKARVAAAKTLFAMAKDALEPLKEGGAKQISPTGTIATRRIDMVYSLIDGLKPVQEGTKAGYKTDRFGLHLEADVAQDDVVAMGKRHGFVLDSAFQAEGRPQCYVKLDKGRNLEVVLTAVLVEEPRVISLNLGYFE